MEKVLDRIGGIMQNNGTAIRAGRQTMAHCNHTKDESWWEYDARGIPLARVCERCQAEKLASYRPDVLTDSGYWADEDIEERY